MVSLVLSTEGFRVVRPPPTESPRLRLARDEPPAAAILDVRLSQGLDGLDVLTALKAEREVPVLVFTGDSDVALRIECMERGADDFIDKPFSPEKLERHVRFLMRSDETPPDPDRAVRVGDLMIDMERAMVFRDGQMLPLGLTGWSLLDLLISHDGEAVLYRELLARALGRGHASHFDLLKACIDRLRVKIDTPTSASKIIDFHGVGYALAYTPVRPAGVYASNPAAPRARNAHADAVLRSGQRPRRRCFAQRGNAHGARRSGTTPAGYAATGSDAFASAKMAATFSGEKNSSTLTLPMITPNQRSVWR